MTYASFVAKLTAIFQVLSYGVQEKVEGDKLNSSLKSSNVSLSRMRLLPASLTSIATVALFPILLTSWLIMYNLFLRVNILVAT